MTELCWIVLDDSGSLTSYDERIRRIHASMRDEFECSFDVRTWTTSSSYGMGALSARPIGSGGGDGMSKMFDMLTTDRGAFARSPCFVVYLTDGEANLTPDIINAIRRFHVVLIDITDPRWNNDCDTNHNLARLHDFLIHECDVDCCECECDDRCACSNDVCLESFESGSQPFYPNWQHQTRHFVNTTGIRDALFKMHDAYKVCAPPEVLLMRNPYRHPVDKDLDDINKTLDQYKGTSPTTRAAVGTELQGRLNRVIGGNSLTPLQWTRINATKYRLLTECISVPHEAAVRVIYGKDADTTINRTHTEVQEGQPMSAQITTTVSLKTSSSTRATLADLKTLITEVERVGGTDESFVDFETHRRTGCLDAVVVTAVEVQITPTLDPRVECVLSIKDDEKRTHALVDLLIDYPRLRSQITPHLINKPEAKPAAKKTTAAKPAKA